MLTSMIRYLYRTQCAHMHRQRPVIVQRLIHQNLGSYPNDFVRSYSTVIEKDDVSTSTVEINFDKLSFDDENVTSIRTHAAEVRLKLIVKSRQIDI